MVADLFSGPALEAVARPPPADEPPKKRKKKKLNTKNWNEATNETSSEDFWAQKQFAFVVCWPAIIRLEKPKNKLKEKTPKKV